MRLALTRIASASALLVIAASWTDPLYGQTIVAGPTTAELAAVAGDRITVPIAIDMTGATGITLGAYRARFSWNPAAFTLVSATGGTFGAPVFNSDSSAQGVVRFAAASATGANGVFVIGNITLEVVATISDTFRVSFPELTAATTFQDLLPYLTVVQGSFCGSGVWGDLTGDGMVQAVDAQAVLMHSVGLAVPDTSEGDVDVNGTVDPRDALIILSYVVGLDVAQFRVGQLVSATCSPGEPDTVAVLPTPVTLAPGDVFALTAAVRDTAGLLLGGKNLVWASSNPAIATVDSTGAVTAVATGTATITAAVAPGVTGSATVTVGPRHRWVVNPAGAQGSATEVGSDLFPFSTIAAAIQRAAPADTVFLMVATYNEPLTASKALVFDGDSGAGGMPVISTPNLGLGAINATGKVTVRRLQFDGAATGLAIRSDTLEMTSDLFQAIGGPAVSAVGPRYVSLDGVHVSGAVAGGIGIDSAGVVHVLRSRVAAIEAPSGTDSVYGFGVRADTATFDLVEVDAAQGQSVGIATVGTRHTLVRRSTIRNVQQGIWADTTGTLEVRDSTTIAQVSGGAIGGVVDTLRMVNVTVSGAGGSAVYLVDRQYEYAELLGVNISGAQAGVYADGGGRALVRRTTISDVGAFGIALDADTLVADTVTMQRVAGSGIELGAAQIAYVRNSTLARVGYGILDYGYGSGNYLEVTGTRIAGVSSGPGIDVTGDSLLMVGDTVSGVASSFGVYHNPYGGGPATWTRITQSLVDSTQYEGVVTYASSLVDIAHVTVRRTNLGSYGYWALELSQFDSLRVDSSAIRDNVGAGLYAAYGRVAVVRADTVERNIGGVGAGSGYSGYETLYLYAVNGSQISGNRIVGNHGVAIQLGTTSVDDTTIIANNVIRGAYQGIQATGYDTLTSRLEISNNSFVGQLGGAYTEQIGAGYYRDIVVQNNTMDSIVGYITDIWPADSVVVTGNTITNLDGDYYAGVSVQRAAASIENNAISCLATLYEAYAIQHFTGSSAIRGNTITNCGGGIYAHNGLYTTTTFDLDIRNNTIVGDTTMVGYGSGILLDGGAYRASIVGNAVRSFGEYGIGVTASAVSWPNMMVRVDTNYVSDIDGVGIVMSGVDSGYVRNDTVTRVAPGEYGSAALGIDVADSVQVSANAIVMNTVDGIEVGSQVASVAIDANLIADNTGDGIRLSSVGTGTLNSIRRNTGWGIDDQVGSGSSFPANNIEGNAYGVYNIGPTFIDVTNSWWGSTGGPACDSCVGAGALGDSISANVTYVPFATDTVVGTPTGAPSLIAALQPAPILAPSPVPGAPRAARPTAAPMDRWAAGAGGVSARRPPPATPTAPGHGAVPERPRVDRRGIVQSTGNPPVAPRRIPR